MKTDGNNGERLARWLGVVCLGILALAPLLAFGSSDHTIQRADLPAAKQKAADRPPKAAVTDIGKLTRARADAAHKAYDVSLTLWKQLQPGGKPEDVYTWSVRWLNAQRDLSSKTADHLSALSEHLKRMQELAQVTAAFTKAGQGSPLSSPAAEFYLREAESWLSQAKTSAEQAGK